MQEQRTFWFSHVYLLLLTSTSTFQGEAFSVLVLAQQGVTPMWPGTSVLHANPGHSVLSFTWEKRECE
jgi:hypothetical protein